MGPGGVCVHHLAEDGYELTQGIQTGMLWINQAAAPWAEMPFGGVKDSGYGSEGGPEALEAYLNTKSVAVMNT